MSYLLVCCLRNIVVRGPRHLLLLLARRCRCRGSCGGGASAAGRRRRRLRYSHRVTSCSHLGTYPIPGLIVVFGRSLHRSDHAIFWVVPLAGFSCGAHARIYIRIVLRCLHCHSAAATGWLYMGSRSWELANGRGRASERPTRRPCSTAASTSHDRNRS